ncbi:MAG: iron-containing alcohol dehydrogenase [Neisseriaceae bacterium]|nr:iron-containing alcohol dehydrogenase [Neisseriaceae bacterium]
MNNFEFVNPTKIIYGEHQVAKLDENIPESAKVLLLYGGGSIKHTGTLDEVKKALGDRTVIEFGGIQANPEYEVLMQAVELIKKEKIDFLLAVGGGSVIDGTKFIAAAVYQDDPWDMLLQSGATIEKAMPIGSVLTISATGSEMNCIGVITRHEKNAKLGFSSPHVFPKFSVLDPSKLLTLPEKQTANGVVDAFVHVLEQYLTYPVNAKIQDRFSEGLLLTLKEEGLKVKSNDKDVAIRGNLMLASTFALNGILGMGVPQDWSTHDIGHQLTALYDIDHAQTLSIVLPGLWKVLKEQKSEKLLQYGERVWDITSGSIEERVDKAVEVTEKFFQEMGLKTKLKDYSLNDESIEEVVGLLEKYDLLPLGEKKNTNADTVRKILKTQLE